MTVAQRIGGRPKDLSDAGVRVSPGLRAVLRRCLQPSPDRRFASAEDLAAALDDPETVRTSGRLRRRALVAAALVVAIIAGREVVRRAVRTPKAAPAALRAASIAVLPLHDETGTPTLAWMSNGIAEMLVESLAPAPASYPAPIPDGR